MTLPTSNIKMSQIQTEYGGANPILLSEYVRGGLYVPSGTTSSYGTIPTTASNIKVGVFRGTTKVVAATFTPDGGTTSGTRVLLSDQGSLYASVTISCSASAVWTWSGGQPASYVTVPSGGTATSITFEVSASPLGGFEFANFTVQATSGSTTRYWSIELIAEDNS